MEFLTPLTGAYCAGVLLAGYALRGSTGFGGFAAMPLLALVVPMKLLVPVWTLLTIASSATIVVRDRAQIQVRHLLRVIPTSFVGVLIGLYVFSRLDAVLLARGFGAFVLGYGLWSLRGVRAGADAAPPSRAERWIGDAASVMAGALGTVFGTMATVFFAVYLDLQRLSRRHFRGTLSAMMLAMGLARVAGYVGVDVLGVEAVLLFGAAFPLTLLGLYLGDRIHMTISDLAFRRIVCAILIVSGVLLLLKG
jgi:uncharacterized membrane protein YfcA